MLTHLEVLMSPEEQQVLYNTVNVLKPKKALEIGSFKGGSAHIISQAAGEECRIFCIDPDIKFTSETINHKNLITVEDLSPHGLNKIRNYAPFDFVFIDGNHSYGCCLDDLIAVSELVHENSVILLHDAFFNQVNQAIQDSITRQYYNAGEMLTSEPTYDDQNNAWGGLYSIKPNVKTNITINNVTVAVRRGTYDAYIWKEVWDQYQGIDYKTISTVLDIGGQAGYFVNMVKHFNPDAQIATIEMENSNYGLLLENIQDLPSVTAYHAILSYENKSKVAIQWDNNTGSNRLVDEIPEGANIHSVPVSNVHYTIEDILRLKQWDKLDVLKLDCEGSEFDILKHMALSTYRQIHYIIGEYHSSAEEAKQLIDYIVKVTPMRVKRLDTTDGLGFFLLENKNWKND